jgi:hypothetical protein
MLRVVRPLTVLSLALATSAGVLSAQVAPSPQCTTASVALQDGCQKAIDLFDFLAPQLATAVAGGNAVLGQGGALGGLGHFTIGIQTNVVKGTLPKFNDFNVSTTGPQSTDFNTQTIPVPMPSLIAGIGLFGGLPLGVTRIGGVDALLSGIYIPSVSSSNISLKPKNSFQIGYGARLGLLSETPLTPAVSVTWMERDLPTTTISGQDNNGDTLAVQNLSVKTSAWRVVASKTFFIIGLAAGAGADHYSMSTDVHVGLNPNTTTACSVAVAGSCSGTVASPSLNITRANYFGDLSLNFAIFRTVFEVGEVAGKAIPTYNTFDGKLAGDSRLYGSVGFLFKI